jgi:hypothetical protein
MLDRPEEAAGTEATSVAASGAGPSAVHRTPLRAVTVLMPVWGYRFVNQFLEFCLPTLLAPGNLPAVAAVLPCRFVLLSSEADEPLIRASRVWRQVEKICDAEIRSIDDLITDGNHTATITLAYARALRETGDAMLDTAFIFLVSDYLVADGSLASVVKRLREGASGVVAGNFQIVAEEAMPLLRRSVESTSIAITLPPRELVSWSLAHLHPATVANMVNFGLSHNAHTNRLFWRVDEHTLIGRFYLMHMIGIRPEVTDFVVGSSCDYSFIPEMCPSGNVAALTDSDDYLVVEMQPREHESKWLLPGPIEPQALADSLLEWTTAQHRGNVAHTIVYHAAERPAALAQTVADSDAFVEKVRRLLTSDPHPHRHHHYWIGSLAANRARTRRPLGKEDWTFLLGEALPSGNLIGALWRARTRLFGSPPDVTRLHPLWPDYGLPLAALKRIIAANGRTLLVASKPANFARWLTRSTGDIMTLEADRLIELPREAYLPLVASFDACLIILSQNMLARGDEFIATSGRLLKRGGQIMILVANDRVHDHAKDFAREFAHHSARLLDASAWIAATYYVPASRLRWAIYRAMLRLARIGDSFGWRSLWRVLLLATTALPLSLLSFLTNLGARARTTPPRGMWSSVFLILRPTGTEAPVLPQRPKIPAPGELADPQCDPIALSHTLARYRFVARLLDSRHDVAEYGRPAALGTDMMFRAVKKLAVYSPNTAALDDVRRQLPRDAMYEARLHNILVAPLPKPHDSIYCLDAIEYVSRSDEDNFIRNLCDSLSRNQDILVVGSRATTEKYRTSAGESEVGFFPRSAAELKALFERFFNVVFVFSMIEEVMHPGAHPAADYALAVCCSRKRNT